MDQFIKQYITLIKDKQQRQKNISWLTFGDPKQWLQALIDEVQEVDDELELDNKIYLEDELWDIFWNYMNFLVLLKFQWYIWSPEDILKQSYQKFYERTSAVLDKKDKKTSDDARDKVKKIQKERLQNQHDSLYK